MKIVKMLCKKKLRSWEKIIYFRLKGYYNIIYKNI